MRNIWQMLSRIMKQSKYIYIISRDGSIYELDYTKERYEKLIEKITNGEKKMFPMYDKNGGVCHINPVDVTKIADDSTYETWRMAAMPRRWIKNGDWFNDKYILVGQEPWKKRLVEEREKKEAKTEARKVEITPRSREIMKNIRKLANSKKYE